VQFLRIFAVYNILREKKTSVKPYQGARSAARGRQAAFLSYQGGDGKSIEEKTSSHQYFIFKILFLERNE
jgi:hypothetical protein